MNVDSDYVKFWETWRWQYLSRNKSYIDDYNNCAKDFVTLLKIKANIETNMLTRDDIKNLFIHAIIVPPQFPGISSGFFETLQKIYHKDFFDTEGELFSSLVEWRNRVSFYFDDKYKMRPRPFDDKRDMSDILNNIESVNNDARDGLFYDYNTGGDFRFAEKSEGGDWNGNVFWIKIDCRKNFDEVVEKLRNYYTTRRLIYEKAPKEQRKIQNKQVRYSLALSHIKNSKSQFKIEHKPRAIGLWLWDRVQQLGGVRGSRIQAIEEFESRPNFDDFCLGRDPDYYHWLKRTEACIETAEVLTFDKRNPETKKRNRPSGTRKCKLVPGTQTAK